MFDFWKEVIINDKDRLVALTSGAHGKEGLRVTRCADYLKSFVVDGKVYKTVADEGACATVTLPAVPTNSDIIRIQLMFGLSAGQDSEFARPWSNFKKVVTIEYGKGANLKQIVADACPNHIATLSDNVLTVVDPKISLKVISEKSTDNGETWDAGATVTPTANRVPAGTGEWILENLRFPTHVNTRVAAPNADDMPIAGAKYNQYAFEYAVPKRGYHGQGAVGQEVTSVTHHVFYVLDTIDGVDTLFGNLGTVSPVTVGQDTKVGAEAIYGLPAEE